jgi:hypothetical protein
MIVAAIELSSEAPMVRIVEREEGADTLARHSTAAQKFGAS